MRNPLIVVPAHATLVLAPGFSFAAGGKRAAELSVVSQDLGRVGTAMNATNIAAMSVERLENWS